MESLSAEALQNAEKSHVAFKNGTNFFIGAPAPAG
jgi:hypothetical protein